MYANDISDLTQLSHKAPKNLLHLGLGRNKISEGKWVLDVEIVLLLKIIIYVESVYEYAESIIMYGVRSQWPYCDTQAFLELCKKVFITKVRNFWKLFVSW